MISGPNLPKKYISSQKRKKVNITIEFYIFKLVYNSTYSITNFSLNWQFGFFFSFDQIYSRRVFPVENGKSTLVCASTVVTYCIKLYFRQAQNGTLMSLLLLIEETINISWYYCVISQKKKNINSLNRCYRNVGITSDFIFKFI